MCPIRAPHYSQRAGQSTQATSLYGQRPLARGSPLKPLCWRPEPVPQITRPGHRSGPRRTPERAEGPRPQLRAGAHQGAPRPCWRTAGGSPVPLHQGAPRARGSMLYAFRRHLVRYFRADPRPGSCRRPAGAPDPLHAGAGHQHPAPAPVPWISTPRAPQRHKTRFQKKRLDGNDKKP